jgi:hypothetical protein
MHLKIWVSQETMLLNRMCNNKRLVFGFLAESRRKIKENNCGASSIHLRTS